MDFKVPKHNTPAATLIKNYQNKKSGKVTVSRREIQRRFNGMEWRHQKKILLAFINASASDREWASRKMFAFWDNSFIPVVKSLWEQYHEISLSWLILRYFRKEYLKDNMSSLSEGRNYYYLCQRLIDEEDFHIDRDRLYESDVIKLFGISKKHFSDDEIKEVFFSMVEKICRGVYKSSYMYKWHTDYELSDISILNNQKVSNVLFEIEYVLGRDYLAEEIRIWNSIVMSDVRETDGYRMLKHLESQETIEYPKEQLLSLIKKSCLKHLNTKYPIIENNDQEGILYFPSYELPSRTQILNEMQADNPSVSMLINSLGLELTEPLVLGQS